MVFFHSGRKSRGFLAELGRFFAQSSHCFLYKLPPKLLLFLFSKSSLCRPPGVHFHVLVKIVNFTSNHHPSFTSLRLWLRSFSLLHCDPTYFPLVPRRKFFFFSFLIFCFFPSRPFLYASIQISPPLSPPLIDFSSPGKRK